MSEENKVEAKLSEENKVEAQPAVVRMTVEIKRANTGKVETYELVGTEEPAKPDEQPKEAE